MDEKDKYYRCGPLFLPEWLRRILTPKIFNHSCYLHDRDWSKKLSIPEARKKNYEFYERNIQATKKSDMNFVYKIWYYILALLYYIFVEIGTIFYWAFYWAWMKKEKENDNQAK